VPLPKNSGNSAGARLVAVLIESLSKLVQNPSFDFFLSVLCSPARFATSAAAFTAASEIFFLSLIEAGGNLELTGPPRPSTLLERVPSNGHYLARAACSGKVQILLSRQKKPTGEELIRSFLFYLHMNRSTRLQVNVG
jgi:hypothetical protein